VVIPWYVTTAAGLIGTAALAFFGWLAVQVIRQGIKLVELENRITQQDHVCTERLVWLRSMDSKLDTVSDGVSEIRGILKPKNRS